jgi:hypothetical protein
VMYVTVPGTLLAFSVSRTRFRYLGGFIAYRLSLLGERRQAVAPDVNEAS